VDGQPPRDAAARRARRYHRPRRIPHGPTDAARSETFFTLSSKDGSNVVESAAILMEFDAAPHERWPKLANACTTPSTRATTPLQSLIQSISVLFD
jgi:hypothetical protein